ncbi:endogenous retrovirus group K member 6 Gag polyprotein-like [Arvicanthis niloticus]|uniref:endogenous retrovirus group K member 6 Gag polyprotein-like n=1 Tax=Arvicanthis niloticus TaxID=61156 RepID=UPI00402BD5AE
MSAPEIYGLIFTVIFMVLVLVVKNCLGDENYKEAVSEGQVTLEGVQDSMSETEWSERLGARKKKDVPKKKDRHPPKTGEISPMESSIPRKERKGGLYPSLELEALTLDSSESSSDDDTSGKDTLNSEEEAELDEEAARYEAERYHPDDNKKYKKLPRIPPQKTVPSAPPPYEAHPPSGYSLVPEKVRRKIRTVFPVFETENGGRIHVPVDFNQLKELAESVRKYGTNANFTLVQLDRLANSALTPADWQMIAKAALPNMGQYIEWKALWYEAAQAQARVNATALTPEQRDWTLDLLTGQGAYTADQANYHWGAYTQVSATAIRAWKALSRKGEASGQLTKIIQGPQESFSDFVARMTEAAGRIFGDIGPVEPLIQQIIFEQATQECRAAIAPRKNKGLQDWLRVCRELGGPLTNAGLAAAILQSQRRPLMRPGPKVCYNCGKPGHFKKDCTNLNRKVETPTLCDRCGKGYHKASACRSVRDIRGRLLPPLDNQSDEMPKNGTSGPRSQGPQRYGNRLVRTQEANRKRNQEITQEDPQGWICEPPPTSY